MAVEFYLDFPPTECVCVCYRRSQFNLVMTNVEKLEKTGVSHARHAHIQTFTHSRFKTLQSMGNATISADLQKNQKNVDFDPFLHFTQRTCGSHMRDNHPRTHFVFERYLIITSCTCSESPVSKCPDRKVAVIYTVGHCVSFWKGECFLR